MPGRPAGIVINTQRQLCRRSHPTVASGKTVPSKKQITPDDIIKPSCSWKLLPSSSVPASRHCSPPTNS